MQDEIISTKDITEYHTDENCYIRELFNRADYPRLSVAQARVTPGTTTALHALREGEEFYYLLSGQGAVVLNGQPPRAVLPGDLVVIPQGMSQRITNTGTSDLVFLCLCTPRFTPESYQPL